MADQYQYVVTYDETWRSWKIEKRVSEHMARGWVYEDWVEFYDTKKEAVEEVKDLIDGAFRYDHAVIKKKDGSIDKRMSDR